MAKKIYIWRVSCNDGNFDDHSAKSFDTIQECYNDMRNAALEKQKWNTDYDELMADGYPITWNCEFNPIENKIVINHCGLIYTYTIEELDHLYLAGLSKTDSKNNYTTELLEKFETPFIEDAISWLYSREVRYQKRTGYNDYKRFCEDVYDYRIGEENIESPDTIKAERISYKKPNHSVTYFLSVIKLKLK